MKNAKLIYHLIITILFVYIFIQFLTLKTSNYIYNFYTKYIMDKYCLVLYILLLFLLVKYDIYTTILLFLLIIGPFKCSTKEYFENNTDPSTTNTSTPSTTDPSTTDPRTTDPRTTEPSTTEPHTTDPHTTDPSTTEPRTTDPHTTDPSTTEPRTTEPRTTDPSTTDPRNTDPRTTNQSNTQESIDKLVTDSLIGVDDRFKIDDIKKNEILRQIKAQINFDPYKTELSKDVIYEIYNKYFDNDVFVKLNSIDEDSKNYIASGNFNYIPKENKVDFDITTYENLNKNTAFGINSQLDDTSKSLN